MNIEKLKIILIVVVFISCSSTKITQKDKVTDDFKHSAYYTTSFFDIATDVKISKEVFKMQERKTFDITLFNRGTKYLFLPKPLSQSKEIKIKIFRKNDNNNKYIPYEQKRVLTTVNRQIDYEYLRNRKIDSIKSGKCSSSKNLQLDYNLMIVDTGDYYAEIEIDISDYGYFKKIKASSDFFEVVTDSSKKTKRIYKQEKTSESYLRTKN